MAAPSVSQVKEHAYELAEKLAKQRGIPIGDGVPNSAELADMVPDFSRGTGALDEEGQPIVGRQPVALPDGGEAGGTPDALAGARAEISGEEAPETKERDAKGRFVSEAAADIAEPTPVVEDEQPQAEAAVEAAAEQIQAEADPWADYEELEYADPDLDKTFKVRVHKEDANAVKGGYMRRADYTKKSMFLAAAKKVVEPLVADGRLQRILPLLERALTDPEYGNFVVDAFQRRQRGEPLTQAQTQAATVAAVAQAAAAPPAPALGPDEDPFMAQYLNPIKEQFSGLQKTVQQLADEERARNTATEAANRENNRRINIAMQGHQALAFNFPDEFTGDPNAQGEMDKVNRVAQYARESGYAQAYPDNPLAWVMAWQHYHAGRAEAAASPAVAAVAQAQAQKVVRQNAAAVPSGTPVTTPAKVKIPPMPQARVNGVPTDPKVYAAAVAARNRAIAQSRGQ